MIEEPPGTRRASRTGLLCGLVVAAAQLAPVLGRGYVLTRDMVFVPHEPLTGQLLGRDGVPRAVPSDLVVALLSRVVAGWVVQDVILIGVIALGAWGAARLLVSVSPAGSPWAPAVAAVAYGWNPYVSERLLLGQWAVLIGYAALPWVARAALDVRRDAPGAWPRLVLALAAGACGGASAQVLTAIVVLPIVGWGGPAVRALRSSLTAVAALGVLALPWLVPALLQPHGVPADGTGVAVFSARADTPLGTLGSLVSLGGAWDADVVPPGRDTAFLGMLAFVVAAGALLACARDRRTRALATAGAIALLLAAAGTIPGLRDGMRAIVEHVPGGGLLRDGQRQLAPLALAEALGLALLAEEIARQLVPARRAAVAAAALVPIALLPSAAWAVSGRLHAATWPSDWKRVAAASSALPAGPVLVLPWSTYRAFAWNGERTQLDPASRWLDRRVIASDDLVVGTTAVRGEDPLAQRFAPIATATTSLSDALRRSGVAGVLVETGTPGGSDELDRTHGLTAIAVTPTLTLFSVPAAGTLRIDRVSAVAITIGDAVALLAVLFAASVGFVPAIRTRHPRNGRNHGV